MSWKRFASAFVLAAVAAVAQQPAPVTQAPVAPGTNAVRRPTLAEIERQYLDGKISARDFQKFLQTYRAQPRPAQPAAAVTNDVHARALAVLHNARPNMAANPQGPAITEPLPDPAGVTNEPNAAVIQDVETKIDELIRLKQAREQTNNTSVTTTNTITPSGVTKRQRLDSALRLHIEGKLSDTEYKQLREKILLEPGD
jgi:hypothetical protein